MRPPGLQRDGGVSHLDPRLGLVDALALAEELGRLPRCVVIYGIEGRNFEPGSEMSAEVGAAVEEVVRHIVAGAN